MGHFWGYPSDEESMTKQQKLTTEINSRTLNPVTVALHPNMCVLAPYAENAEQSLYYRAKILHISANVVEVSKAQAQQQVHVFLGHLKIQKIFFYWCLYLLHKLTKAPMEIV